MTPSLTHTSKVDFIILSQMCKDWGKIWAWWRARGDKDDRERDDRMASPRRWPWVRAHCGRRWRTGKPGAPTGWRRGRQDCAAGERQGGERLRRHSSKVLWRPDVSEVILADIWAKRTRILWPTPLVMPCICPEHHAIHPFLEFLFALLCFCCWGASAVSKSVRPQRRQPPRLPRPWDSPGENTGGGCHCLLQCMKVKSEREVAQSCPTLSDPVDCSPPGSSVRGVCQARVLEWVPFPSPTLH